MSIDWPSFTPWASLAGGILIGVAASVLILFNGRIAGISGILGGLLKPVAGDAGWRIAFIGGLLGAPLIYGLITELPAIQIDAGYGILIIAGLLVGVGTRYGAGCTSGHGVCGLSRLSPRSLVATITFMAAGFAATYMVRHLILN
ncbi:YeeE/YedE family protein [Burkholderia sp. LMU1-1-1.1]|uniref:YeeE/YedE family protein n=1 Tax=Burkholderia sp. LMU1-1-1.1 TaxID=3135266 RepID=UPI00344A5B1E